MRFLPIRNIVRLVLAATVSVWMAGAGCLLGCSKETQASSLTGTRSSGTSSAETVVAEDSCQSAGSSDCCAKKAHKQTQPLNTGDKTPTDKLQLGPVPTPISEDCPMAISAAAIVSKVRSDTSLPVLTRPLRAPFLHEASGPVDAAFNQPNLFNRGPTYLRCCVFLI